MDAQIFVEYVMLNQVNDAPETAHELGQLLRGKNMILNLIPWNPIYSPDMHFEAPGGTRVAAFQRIVREDYGVFCTVRQEMGQDISGNLPYPKHSFAALIKLLMSSRLHAKQTCSLRGFSQLFWRACFWDPGHSFCLGCMAYWQLAPVYSIIGV